MIYGFTVENHLGESLKFTLSDANPDHGLIVKEITGLGPVKAAINISDYATYDGGQFNSARAEKRNITITFKIRGNYEEHIGAVEYSRQLTYKYFPLKQRVHLIFDQFDHRTADTYGYVESNEPNIFSNDEETTISIVCDDPYFYKYGYGAIQKTDFSSIKKNFEFPFENPVNEKELEFSKITTDKDIERSIYYEGDVEVGIKMTIKFNWGVASNGTLVIVNASTGEEMKIDIGMIGQMLESPILKLGDEIIISTQRKQQYVRFMRDGATTNIINAMDRASSWFKLVKGRNVFLYVTDPDINQYLNFTIENKVAYEGV